MPTNPFERYQSQVNDFNQKYGVNFSFNMYAVKLNQNNHMHEFFTNEKKSSAADMAYRSVAQELFKEAVESMVMKKANFADHTAFLNDFDKLMDNYREHCKETGGQQPGKNGGWGNMEMLNDLSGKIKNIPSDKSEFIKNSYMKRKIRLRDMRADIESMERDGRTATVEELSRAIVYQRALEKTIKERSFIWKATHWFQGPAEKRDLETINRFIGKYSHSIYNPPAEALADEDVIGQVKSKLEAAKEEIKDKELLKPRKLNEVKQADERLRNPKIKDHMLKVMSGIVKDSTSDERSKNGLLTSIVNENPKIMMTAWKAFENATTPEAKEEAIIKNTQEVFNVCYKWVNGLSFKDKSQSNVHDKIVASQRITNLILKQYSPAMSDSAYEKYHNDYVINDKTFMDGFLKDKLGVQEMSEKDLDNILNAIKQDISEKKTRVKDLEKDINHKNVEKSDKRVEAPRIEAQVKTN